MPVFFRDTGGGQVRRIMEIIPAAAIDFRYFIIFRLFIIRIVLR